MKPLMIGPDGLVESATRREMAHLNRSLERDVKSSLGKGARQNVTKPTLPRQKARDEKRQSDSANHHLNAITPESMVQKAATRGLMSRCPLCSTQVREDRLQKHISSKCPSRLVLNSRLSPQAKQTISRRALNSRSSSRRKSTISLRDIELFVKCPTCGAKVASDQFTKHRAVAHGRTGESRGEFQTPVARNQARSGEPGAVKRSKKSKKGGVSRVHSVRDNAEPESARQKDKIEVERPSWWDNLDATKNCGYPAREEGRYGSYPSHDGFDDESKP
jgi:endogenous inhibitor of DNA gyrase (YacG/DUF329 family)